MITWRCIRRFEFDSISSFDHFHGFILLRLVFIVSFICISILLIFFIILSVVNSILPVFVFRFSVTVFIILSNMIVLQTTSSSSLASVSAPTVTSRNTSLQRLKKGGEFTCCCFGTDAEIDRGCDFGRFRPLSIRTRFREFELLDHDRAGSFCVLRCWILPRIWQIGRQGCPDRQIYREPRQDF